MRSIDILQCHDHIPEKVAVQSVVEQSSEAHYEHDLAHNAPAFGRGEIIEESCPENEKTDPGKNGMEQIKCGIAHRISVHELLRRRGQNV